MLIGEARESGRLVTALTVLTVEQVEAEGVKSWEGEMLLEVGCDSTRSANAS